jgi:CRP/FNR family transcriptional regulator, cyclic AMP receptor protein
VTAVPSRAPVDPRPRGGALLLDLHPGLGAHLAAADRDAVGRALRLPVLELPSGPVDVGALAGRPEVIGPCLGLCIARGVLIRDTLLDGRVSTQLLVRDDLLLVGGVHDDALAAEPALRVSDPALVVVLDDRLLAACRRWPRLLTGVLRRLELQTDRLQRAQAINHLPRVEDRLIGLFWTFADHFGRVHPDGVHIDLALTHTTIGQMIGARRPTVSLGLAALAADGLLHADRDSGWVLATCSRERFTRHVAQGANTARTQPSPLFLNRS